MSYLADVKSQLKGVFDEAFEYAWKDVVEPALKESYRNGVQAARSGKENSDGQPEQPQRRRWGKRAGDRRG